MRRFDVHQRRHDTLDHRLVRLAVAPTGAAVAPLRVALRKPRLDLAGRQAGPFADVDLAKPRVETYRQPEQCRDDLRRLARPCEVGGVRRVDLAVEPLRERPRLLAPELVER